MAGLTFRETRLISHNNKHDCYINQLFSSSDQSDCYIKRDSFAHNPMKDFIIVKL